MTLFRFLSKKQCPHTLEVKENFVVAYVVRCTRDVEHKGMHTNGSHTWMCSDTVRRYVEEHGRGL